MRRRDFVIRAGVAGVAWPLFARAQQQTKVRRVGFLGARSRSTPASPDSQYDAFVKGLRDLGYIEGQNITVEWRFADGRFERLPALAAELVKLNPEVLVTHGTQASQVLQRATRTIPIVFVAVGNPVESGLVASLARPEANVTGQANLTHELSPKQLELLKEIVPKLSRVAVLFNPGNTTSLVILERCQTFARQSGMQVLAVSAYTPQDIERGFALISHEHAEAILVVPDNLMVIKRAQIVRAAAKHRLPSLFPFSEDAVAGGLLSFGPNNNDIYRRAAGYVDKILKGVKPSELPVEQPTQFELVLNNKTAKAIGIKFPQSVLARADRVIE